MKTLLILVTAAAALLASDREACFSQYSAGKLDKKELMRCIHVKDVPLIPLDTSDAPPVRCKPAYSSAPVSRWSSHDYKTNYLGITSISHLSLIGINTDADADLDAARIMIILGDKYGKRIAPPHGMSIDYTATVREYDPRKKVAGRTFASKRGSLVSSGNYFEFVADFPPLKRDVSLLVDVQVKLPNGKMLYARERKYFRPRSY